ncbi:MAG: hypothetical protein ABIP20_06705 [Chthoniobacteraceae bacterium]
MDDQDLDELLSQRRDSVPPPIPPIFQQGVWREIRRRKSEARKQPAAWLAWLLEPLLEPAGAFAALAFALLVGGGLGGAAMGSTSRRTHLASDLQVFGSAAPALPATLLGAVK